MIDPNETVVDRRKHELLQCYRRGFKHGASANARDSRFLDHQRAEVGAAYTRGYEDGMAASILASARECERLQYDPRFSVLRSPAPTSPPGLGTHSPKDRSRSCTRAT
jgi:hypothetical protein